jgi:hypothetical protein
MARQRRSGGFKPPELRGTLGTLLRTTLQQAGVVRDALARGASEGRSRIDDFRSDLRSSRRRSEALAELGEIVLDLIRNGEIDLAELPEAQAIVDHIEELDAEADASGDDNRDKIPTVPPPSRKPQQRFDDRRSSDDDGTVSSSRWSPPPRRPGKQTKIWKPTVSADAPPDEPEPRKSALPRDVARKGGISFDSDDDLADYMHPDDVPSKKDD